MSKQKFGAGMNGKGYYIALVLCAVAIGISGYLYYRNANETDPSLQQPTLDAGVTDPNDHVDTMVTEPGDTTPTNPNNPTVPSRPFKTGAPVVGTTVTDYAMDCLVYNQTTRDWRVHNGMDIGADAGTAVSAAAEGTVYTVYQDDTMGTTVVIRHQNDYMTKYSSLDQNVCVAPGDTVTLGQTIGYVGNTALLETAIGPHVHFSVTCNGEIMDPAEFLSLNEN